MRRSLTRINTIAKSLTRIRVYSGNERLISEFKEQGDDMACRMQT